jgi:hypothetical protein
MLIRAPHLIVLKGFDVAEVSILVVVAAIRRMDDESVILQIL